MQFPSPSLPPDQKDHRTPKQRRAEARAWTPQRPEGEEEEPGEEEAGADYHSDFESLSIRTEQDHSPSEISEHLGARSHADQEARRKERTQGGDDASEITGDGGGSRWEEGDVPGDDPCDDPYASSFSDRSRSAASSYTSGCSAQSSSRTLTPSSRRPAARRRPGREAATQTRADPLSYAWSAGNQAAPKGYSSPKTLLWSPSTLLS